MNGARDVQGFGATPHAGGTVFRVWAPHARRVCVIGTFNGWESGRHVMRPEPNGCWTVDVPSARAGDRYKFQLTTAQGELKRIDPYAREVTGSVGDAIVHDPGFDWAGDEFQLPPRNELVVYELHVGTFSEEEENVPGQFATVASRLGHLKKLGVNAIQIMPIAQFAGQRSWGYNPAHIFSVETDYGGPLGFKRFVKRAHAQGLAVILDVVYNHLGPSDLDLWRFDGWSENGRGGIYFYNDDRAGTPWGDTRPDYGRSEVRQFLLDNARMWLGEYHVDGLRIDGTVYIRTAHGPGSEDLPDGWSLLQAINALVAESFPGRLTIAEDLQNNPWLTKEVGAGGAGFGAQWDANFVHPIRRAVITPQDEQRSIGAIGDAIRQRDGDDAFARVIYSESHDEVASGRSRVPSEINPADPTGWYAQKRSTLAAAMVFTAPGIPMIFQGQEFLEGGWFRDTVPLNWDQREEFHGILRLYRDLIALRLNRGGCTRGLCGPSTQMIHANDARKLMAFHRWDRGGPLDDVVVVANFHREPQDGYVIGFPAGGLWKLRFNSDWKGYSDVFAGHPSADVTAHSGERDGLPWHATLAIGPYSALIFSQ
ncbi:alpha-amylase family glycosyl hydrolase [Rubrivivax sp. RP6-9]|uniref:alpha-amylase family glycosyl hydrolase n=1 Tax=Rubrivivax sp. RP6-9 TaxID=3415750 RepID=UPI003CC62A3A